MGGGIEVTLPPQFNPILTAVWLSLKRRALFSFLWSSVTPNLTLERISFGGGKVNGSLVCCHYDKQKAYPALVILTNNDLKSLN